MILKIFFHPKFIKQPYNKIMHVNTGNKLDTNFRKKCKKPSGKVISELYF